MFVSTRNSVYSLKITSEGFVAVKVAIKEESGAIDPIVPGVRAKGNTIHLAIGDRMELGSLSTSKVIAITEVMPSGAK
jgi:hypothetical protein